jgi:hypothetical protein
LIVIQTALLTAVQAHPSEAVTTTCTSPPAADVDALLGATV